MKSSLFKRVSAGLLALLMLGASLPAGSDFTGLFGGTGIVASAASQSGTCGENAEWEFDSETGTLTVSGTGAMQDYDDDQPWYSFRDDINKVVVENGITTVGECAFEECQNITDVILSDDLTVIGHKAFFNCTKLERINSPASLQTIDNAAFLDCHALKSFVFPSSLTVVSSDAFRGCSSIDSVICYSDKIADWSDTEGYLQFKENKKTTCYVVGMSDAEYAAFTEKYSGINITFSKAIDNKCGDNATWFFDGRTLTISGTGAMSDYKFVNVGTGADTPWNMIKNSIENVLVEEGITHIGSYSFINTRITEVKIADSVVSFGERAFSGTALESIDLSNTKLKEIPQYAFEGCSYLVSVNLPDTVETIGAYAFQRCKLLTDIKIPESVTSIADGAFVWCRALKMISIPKNVTSIGKHAFYGCISMTDVYCYADPTVLSWDLNTEIHENDYIEFMEDGSTVCHVLKGFATTLRSKYLLSNLKFADDLSCGDNAVWYFDSATGKLSIKGYGPMYDYGNGWETPVAPWDNFKQQITSVEIDDEITTIGEYSFYNCYGLKSVNIPKKALKIGSCAFSDCNNLSDVTLPEGLDIIGASAFYSCYEFKNITIPSTVSSIGEGAFYCCTNAESLTFVTDETTKMSKLEKIGDSAFSCLWSVKELVLPEGLKTIDKDAFYYCTAIESVYIPSTVTKIGAIEKEGSDEYRRGAFTECLSVEDVYIFVTDVESLEWAGAVNSSICSQLEFKYSLSDPSNSGSETMLKVTKCHVPKGTIAAYNAKFNKNLDTDVNVKFVNDPGKISISTSQTGGSVTANVQSAIPDEEVELTVTPDTGYKLKSLVVKDTTGKEITVTDNKFKMPDSDVTVSAEFEPISYSITYDLNDGTNPDTAPVSYTVEADVTLPTPTKPGYTFDGWYENSSFSGDKVTTIPEGSTGNKTYYAKWTIENYTISYTLNGGTNPADAPTSFTVESNAITLPTPSRTGYTFGGWYKKSDFSGDKVTSIPKGSTGNKAYYAKWNAINYTISYTLNGGTNPADAPTGFTVESNAITLPTPSRTGYSFGGWYEKSDFSGNKVTSIPKGSTGNKTYYAKWNAVDYTIAYTLNGGTNPADAPIGYNVESATITLPTPERKGYTFGGWYEKSDFSGDKATSIPKGSTGNKTYYAKWNAINYTISYTLNGGTNPADAPTGFTVESNAITLPTPGRTGHTFDGWYEKSDFSGNKVTSIPKGNTGNKTYYAKWNINKYNIVWKNGDTVLKSEQVEYGKTPRYTGSTPSLKANAQFSYTFIGWKEQIVPVTKDATYTADFRETTNTYTIKFVNFDGAELQSSEVPYGETPQYTGDTPVKPSSVQYGYTFKGWSPEITAATGDATYTALYERKRIGVAVTRLAGKDRYGTAVEISASCYERADTVILAYSMNYADAHAGVPLANKLKAPLLLTNTKTLNIATLAEIKRLGAKNVIILGGDNAISTDVENALKAQGLKTERVAGKTRFSTATAVAEKVNEAPETIFFVYGFDYADALSISSVAALKNSPIVYLTTNGTLDPETAEYLAKLKTKGCVKNAYVIGGTGVISDDMVSKATKVLGIESAARIAGANRYETCVEVNKAFADMFESDIICVATGKDFPDALAGGAYAAFKKAPFFLAADGLSDEQKALLKAKAPMELVVFGGTSAVPDELVDAIVKACI